MNDTNVDQQPIHLLGESAGVRWEARIQAVRTSTYEAGYLIMTRIIAGEKRSPSGG